MAVGRRDYTWGFLNEAAVEGRYSATWVKAFGASINSGENAYLYLYVVPVGYRLVVNRIDISTNSRIVNVVSIGLPPGSPGYIYFSDNYCFMFSDQNPLYVEAGNSIFIVAYNQDEIACYFYGILTEVLQQLT